MPKVEISQDHLERVAQAIGGQAAQLPQGAPERLVIERLLLNDEKMLAAFINWHTSEQ
jgi:hypothetical protein